jgi:hypothetical protein
MKRHSRWSPTVLAATLAATTGLAACSHPAPEPATPQEREAAIVVTVNNKAYSDIDVYAVAQAGSRRLGTARAASTTNLNMPASYLTPSTRTVRLRGKLIGGSREVLSQSVAPQPGAIVEWTIENNLTSSILMR